MRISTFVFAPTNRHTFRYCLLCSIELPRINIMTGNKLSFRHSQIGDYTHAAPLITDDIHHFSEHHNNCFLIDLRNL